MNTLAFLCSNPPMPEMEQLEHSWKELYLDKVKTYVLPANGQKWGRLILAWNEKIGEQFISHTYAPWVDIENWSGIYYDDRPFQIYIKIFMQCLCRPLHLIVKTVYHLALIPLFYELWQVCSQQQSIKESLIQSARSLADIVRTPLFDLINLVSSIALLLLSPFNPEMLLDGRQFLGMLENGANWGERRSIWTLAPCFQPIDFSYLYLYENRQEEDTLYPTDDPLDRQLTNFARSAIHHKQTHIDITSCQKAPMHVPYDSMEIT